MQKTVVYFTSEFHFSITFLHCEISGSHSGSGGDEQSLLGYDVMSSAFNPLPLLFKTLLHGQKDCDFFSAGI